MRILSTRDFGYRKVVNVVKNPDDPEWVHPDGRASPSAHTGDTEERDKEVCKLCIGNWRVQEFIWTDDNLRHALNKWGNPVQEGQDVASVRDKTWDELYREIDGQVGEHVVFGDAPRNAVPVLAPETEPDFELLAVGTPHMEDGLAKQRYKVLRKGQAKAVVISEGADKASFDQDKTAKFDAAKIAVLSNEASLTAATVIVG
jgi:hypothetical protein